MLSTFSIVWIISVWLPILLVVVLLCGLCVCVHFVHFVENRTTRLLVELRDQ